MAESKEIEVACPCCGHRLAIDVLTRRVVRSAPPEKLDATGKPVVDAADWDRALDRVRKRHSAGEERFEGALERERRREKDLEDLFRRAAGLAKDERPSQDPPDGSEDERPDR